MVSRPSNEAAQAGSRTIALRPLPEGISPVPENLVKQFNAVYDSKDRLEKVHDYVMKCQNMEEDGHSESLMTPGRYMLHIRL